MGMMPLPFEVQDGVDHVLECFRAGKAAVLRHVPHEERGHVLSFRLEQQLGRGLADLAHAPRRRLELEREDRLNRIDDDERRLEADDLVEDVLETRFGEQIEGRVADREALTARLDLVLGFLPGAVQHGTDGPGHVRGGLEQQRGLADPGLAAEQHERSRHDAAAEHAVELVDAGRQPRVLPDLDLGVQHRGRRAAHGVAIVAGRGPRAPLRALFDQGIPGAAVRAAAEPFRGLRPALLAGKDGLGGFAMTDDCELVIGKLASWRVLHQSPIHQTRQLS